MREQEGRVGAGRGRGLWIGQLGINFSLIRVGVMELVVMLRKLFE